MNKKIVALVTSLALGGTMLITTAFASANEVSGYDTYKAALLNMQNVKSLTCKADVSVKDNGNSLIAADSQVKVNLDNKTMSSTVDLKNGSIEKSVSVFKEIDKTITKTSDSDVYNVIQLNKSNENKASNKKDEKISPERLQSLTNIVDALVGNMKSYFTLSNNTDGNKTVTVKLSESQVLPVANAVASAIMKDKGAFEVKENKLGSNFTVNVPKLESDIRVTSIDVTANINKDNIIDSQVINVTLVGKDANGIEHNLTAVVNMNISNMNNTTPDFVNLSGKQTKTVTEQNFRYRN
ncbi:hypothetical protein [Candidatus Clostridium stratigraminis]|uniref:Uncharacterized protein n=1 Tax=Candidatus Clostridium stratigraminis TaxID=3381661 RepID=A0ABW8T5W9_9CLOT